MTRKICHKRVRNTFNPLIPVLIHQVVHYPARCILKIWVPVGRCFHTLYTFDKEDLITVRRKLKTINTALYIGNLSHTSSIGIHAPDLRSACFVSQEGNFLSSVYPLGVTFRCVCNGQLLLF